MIAKYHKFQCVKASRLWFEAQDGLFIKNLFIISDVYWASGGFFAYKVIGQFAKGSVLMVSGISEIDIAKVVPDKNGTMKQLLIAYTAKRKSDVAPKQRKLTYRTIRKR